jgi:hypothetical protein
VMMLQRQMQYACDKVGGVSHQHSAEVLKGHQPGRASLLISQVSSSAMKPRHCIEFYLGVNS